MRYVISIAILLSTIAIPLSAQTTQGNAGVTGTVRDASGAVIPDAKVVLTETARQLNRATVTNSAGSFLFPSIAPGVYSLHVTRDGFAAYEMKDIRFDVGQLATLDVTLEVGSTSTVVSVSAGQGVLLDRDSNALGTVVGSSEVQQLPLNGRNFLDLTKLSGGAVTVGGGNAPGGAVTAQSGHSSRAVALLGNMSYMTGYLIDGIASRGGRLGESALNVSIAAIDQFKVQQSFFMPDQGPNAALVSVTTKGGTNSFHGQAFDFLRNDAFDASNFFSATKDDLKRNQFGGALGGPVLKNRLWFYGYYEGTRQVETVTSNGFTPTAAMFSGDFSALPVTIYDPATHSTTTGKRTAFPDNKIPSGRISPVSAKLLKYYLPGSSLTSKPSNVFGHPRHTLDDDQFGIRLDTALSSRQNFYGQFIHENSPAVSAGLMPLQGDLFQESANLIVLEHTMTFSPSLVNTARIGYLHNLALDSNVAVHQGDILGPIGITNTYDNRGLPSITMTGYHNLGSGEGDLGNIDNSYQIGDELYYSRGRHTLQMGANVRYYRTSQGNLNAQAIGLIGFQPLFTAQSTAKGPLKGTGDAFADFLLGYPATGTVNGLPKIPYRFTQYMPYASDLWKLTPNLTLNYGISWFLATVPDPQGAERDWAHGFDPATGLLTYAALGQINRKLLSFEPKNLAPRVGIAWSPSFMPNTVVRSGFGIYYTDISLSDVQYAVSAPPYAGANILTVIQTNPTPPYQFGVNTFPTLVFPPFDKDYPANLPVGTSALLLDPNSSVPYVEQWNLSIQHSLGRHDVLEADYVGSSGHRMQIIYDSNPCIPTADLFCDYATRPYPRYNSLGTFGSSGISSYDGLILKYDHRVSAGLNLHSEYTFAKSLGNGIEMLHDPTQIQDSTCLRCNYSRTSFDVNHSFVVSAIYDLPFGRGRMFGNDMPRALDLAAGGWSVTAIGSLATGFPVQLSSPNTTNSGTDLPNRTCNGNSGSLLGNLRSNGFKAFDTSCFSQPATQYYGTSRQNVITGPGVDNWNVGIHKSFPLIVGDSSLDFRAEMFNAFNHANFSSPGGNVGNTNTFGIVSAADAPRIIQLGLMLHF